jgi:hypothetical protein
MPDSDRVWRVKVGPYEDLSLMMMNGQECGGRQRYLPNEAAGPQSGDALRSSKTATVKQIYSLRRKSPPDKAVLMQVHYRQQVLAMLFPRQARHPIGCP